MTLPNSLLPHPRQYGEVTFTNHDSEANENENEGPEDSSSNDVNEETVVEDAEAGNVSLFTDPHLVLDPDSDLQEFAFQTTPQNVTIRCCVIRSKGLHRTYHLYMERENGKKIFLLSARQHRSGRQFTIFYQPTNTNHNSECKIGEVHSNFVGTEFVVYDTGASPSKAKSEESVRRELAWVLYDTSFMGMKGPRRMTILLPVINSNQERVEFRASSDKDSMFQRYVKKTSTSSIIELRNKKPIWNKDRDLHVLDFSGRVTTASIKNFQLIHEDPPEYMVLQFGKVEKNVFSLDYKYPLCALQAFGIVLSCMDTKIMRD